MEKYEAKQYVQMTRILTKVKEYVLTGVAINLKARNAALEQGNEMAFHYMQGGLDVCADIKLLIEGYELTPTDTEKQKRYEPGMMHG
ncbi:MAG: hypothetical protein ACXQTR_02595 [Candidatus Methanospirareceae archaeon]